MEDILILSHSKQFVIPLRQVAHFRIDESATRKKHAKYRLLAVSALPRGDGTWFEMSLGDFKSNEAALVRIEKLTDSGELFQLGPEPSAKKPSKAEKMGGTNSAVQLYDDKGVFVGAYPTVDRAFADARRDFIIKVLVGGATVPPRKKPKVPPPGTPETIEKAF